MDEKIYRDIRTQIGILKSRGLDIRSKSYAKQLLINCNYYNLINGYKEPFLQTGTASEKYIPGTKIEEIYALYEFDRKLRVLTLEFGLEVEKRVKSIIAHCFSAKYGHKDYLRPENFDINGEAKYKNVCALLSNIYNKIYSNIGKDLSISHYVDGKQYVPLWVLVNSMSMGDISKFYSSMLQADRCEVAKRMKWGIKENQLESCLVLLSSMRNRCAHDERLYSYKSYASLIKNRYFNYFGTRPGKNTNNYFAVMVAFKMMLSHERYCEYHGRVEQLFDELSKNISTISHAKIRDYMGMPVNWNKLGSL